MADAQEQKKIVVAGILKLYEKVLGETTARLYADFYQDKDIDTIKLSAHELLDEFMGKQKATDELDRIYQEANITK